LRSAARGIKWLAIVEIEVSCEGRLVGRLDSGIAEVNRSSVACHCTSGDGLVISVRSGNDHLEGAEELAGIFGVV